MATAAKTRHSTGDREIEALCAHLGARYSAHTVAGFTRHARKYLALVGPVYERRAILRYIDHLIEQQYQAQSIHTMIGGVRALYDALDQPWPLKAADRHLGLPQTDEGGPVMAANDVYRLAVYAARMNRRPYSPLVALSTTFGLRAAELETVLNAGCGGDILRLQTAKRGRVRQHRIPPHVRGVLTFPPIAITRDNLYTAFHELHAAALGRPPRRGEGWHAIRRALYTELRLADVSDFTLHRFFGWRLSQTGFKYFRPEMLRVDSDVFAAHPWLAAWDSHSHQTRMVV